MNEIYVTGHRNPDTDSIVAAMAYANLRNALGDREYTAVRIGSVNDETLNMLHRVGFEAPPYIKNMRNQVCDLDFDHPPELHRSVPLELAWQSMRDGQIATIPILNDDGTLYGVLSAGDVASYDLRTVYESEVSDIPLFNLISVLEGYLVNEFAETSNSVSGKVQIAVPKSYSDEAVLSPDSILICGDQPEVIKTALEAHVGCLIICQADIPPELTEIAGHTCIISTPLDARQAARLIYQAVPVMRLCQTQDIICFHLNDYIDDVKETLLSSRYRCYPVLDENEKVVGTLSRFHLLRPRRKRVVLVDHNEASQSVPGLEQVEILEIIDHHRLADIQTKQPIAVRNEPVGSTNTIITAIDAALNQYAVVSDKAMATVNLVIGIVVAMLVALVLLGGVKRIGSVSEKLVPFMALTYVVLALGVVLLNLPRLPEVFTSIVAGAFNPAAFTGGAVGSLFLSMQKGVSRGIFSNEAGLGTGSIAHACADTKKPVKQGMFGIFEVFADTIVICTLTALVILCSGTSVNYGQAAGAELTISGFTLTYGGWASLFTAVALCCFAFSTIIGWGLYGSRCIEYLFHTDKVVRPFLVVYSFVAILGATVDLGLLWSIADTFNGLMSIPNLIALLLLSGTVVKLVKEFFAKEPQ